MFPPEKPIEWISKYGSISFNQFGAEFPYGGINEEGLVVEIMTSRAEYPFKIAIQEFIDTTSTTINVLPFEKEISLLTNPIINNSISISAIVPIPKKHYISVYNLMGKLIAFKEQTLHTGTKTIKLPFYKKGLFLLNISTNKNEKLVYKIINR